MTAREPYRVLVVDDDPVIRRVTQDVLTDEGFVVTTAENGVAALAAIELQSPDVILLDIGLPALSGYEVCRRLRSQPWGKRIVIIALTGWGQEEDRRKSREAGFDGHLVKPVDYPTLMTLLGSLAAERNFS